jgi:hypothetical protein
MPTIATRREIVAVVVTRRDLSRALREPVSQRPASDDMAIPIRQTGSVA